MFSKQAANSLVTETSQYFVFFCRSVCSAILAKCLIINDLRLILVILFFIAFLNITYTARHTFSTVVALANNVSLENVAKMLGHTNTKMTQRYAKVLDQIFSEICRMYGRASLLKPPKDKNGYPIHSDGSRFFIFILLKTKENNLLYYRRSETYLPTPF